MNKLLFAWIVNQFRPNSFGHGTMMRSLFNGMLHVMDREYGGSTDIAPDPAMIRPHCNYRTKPAGKGRFPQKIHFGLHIAVFEDWHPQFGVDERAALLYQWGYMSLFGYTRWPMA